jgi:hypothetical protein
MPDSGGRRHTSITQRKAERELFFWTAFKVLKLILAAAAVSTYSPTWSFRWLPTNWQAASWSVYSAAFPACSSHACK